MSLRNIIEESIYKLGEDFRTNKKSYLSEADALCSLFTILKNKLDLKQMNVHSQLRPFYKEMNNTFVLRRMPTRKIDWVIQEKANLGSLVDLSIIDIDKEYWIKAYAKALEDQHSKNIKWWRILSYPVEALKAVIEIKVKVYGNFDEIEEDVYKLEMIGKKKIECLLYFVLLDRRSKHRKTRNIDKTKEYCKTRNITCIPLVYSI